MNKSIIKTLTILLLLIISYLYICTYYDNKYSIDNSFIDDNKEDILNIYFFDVGEADSTLIRYKEYNLLIDGGNTVDGVLLVPYLKEIGIDHFNYIFATHAHEDHIGGLSRVIYNFPVEYFYMPNHPAKWKSYDNLMKALNKKNITVNYPYIGEKIHLDDVELMILWVDDSEEYNDNSIIIKLNYKNTDYLFMSDAEANIERNILDYNLKSDVLKVGHHGSKYASSAVFLEKVHPKYAIISCAKDNEYGHPHQITLDKLDYINSKIYRTDINHTIHLTSNGYLINIELLNKSFNGGDL